MSTKGKCFRNSQWRRFQERCRLWKWFFLSWRSWSFWWFFRK